MKQLFNPLSRNSNFVLKPITIGESSGFIALFENTYSNKRLEFFLNKLRFETHLDKLNELYPSTFKIESLQSIDNIVKELSLGKVYLYLEKYNLLYVLNINDLPSRSINESELDPVNLFGSKDSFVESIKTNITLILKRVKDKKLSSIDYEIGDLTKNDVKLLYIDGLIDKSIILKIDEILKKIHLKGVRNLGDIVSRFNKNSLVPLVQFTSSPEVVQNSLLNGRCVILVDNYPVAIILPITMDNLTNLPDEASAPKYYLFYTRTIIGLLLFLSIFFLGLYVSIINFHVDFLSMQIIAEIKVSNKGSTLPLFGEILFITFIFEFLRIAASKTPSSYIQSLVITVGGLLIGQNTVSSGFVSPFNLVITTLSYLASYGVTNNKHLIISFSYFRFFILGASIFCGLLGFVMASIIVVGYLCSKKSINLPFISPLTFKELKEMFNSKFKSKTLATKEEL